MYVAGEQSEGKYTEAQQQYTLALALAKDANDRSKQEQAKWILMGLGYREEKVQKFLADAAKQTAVRKAEIETNAYLVCGTLVANGELSNNEKFEDAKLLLQQLAGDGPITPEIIHAAAAYLSRDGANIKFNMQGAANGAQTLVGIDQVKTLNSNLVAQLKAGLTVPTSLAPNTQFTIDGVLVQTDSHGKATMMVDVTDIQPARSSAVDYDDQHAEMWGAELDAPRPKGLMERFRDWSGITTLKQSIAMELSNLPPTLRPGAEDSYREDFGRNRQKVRDGIITQAEFNAWRDRMIAQDPTRPSFPVNSDAGLIGYLGFGGLGSQAAVVGENGLQVFGKPLSVVKDEIRGLQAAGVDKATIVDYLRTGRFPTSPGWRPTALDTEADLARLTGGNSQEYSYFQGVEVPRGFPGSTRPDVVVNLDALEAKNYILSTSRGRSSLVSNVLDQAQSRALQLPAGMRQRVILDMRGQSFTEKQLNLINGMRDRIIQRSNGAIYDVRFIGGQYHTGLYSGL
jgi:hypothetical protein